MTYDELSDELAKLGTKLVRWHVYGNIAYLYIEHFRIYLLNYRIIVRYCIIFILLDFVSFLSYKVRLAFVHHISIYMYVYIDRMYYALILKAHHKPYKTITEQLL